MRRFKGRLGAATVLAATALLATSWTSIASAGSTNYQTALAKLEQTAPPRWEGPTKPAPAKKGVKIAYVSSDQALQGDADEGQGVVKAAKLIDWQERTFDGQGSTTTQNEQIANAVTWGAKVIILGAVDTATVSSGLAIAKKAHVIVIPSNGSAPGDVSVNNTTIGKYMGSWIVDNSRGTADALILGDKEFAGAYIGPDEAEKVLTACTGCTVAPVTWFTESDIASNLGPEVVSDLRNNPKINYVLVPYDPAVQSVVTALQGAGLSSQVQIVSNLGDEQNLQYVQAGTVEHADLAWDNTYLGFAAVDQGIRALDKLPRSEPYGENIPIRLLTSSDLGSASKYPNGWVAPYSYENDFLKLWK